MNANGDIFSESTLVTKRWFVGRINDTGFISCKFVTGFRGAVGSQTKLADIGGKIGFGHKSSRNRNIHKISIIDHLFGADSILVVIIVVAAAAIGVFVNAIGSLGDKGNRVCGSSIDGFAIDAIQGLLLTSGGNWFIIVIHSSHARR